MLRFFSPELEKIQLKTRIINPDGIYEPVFLRTKDALPAHCYISETLRNEDFPKTYRYTLFHPLDGELGRIDVLLYKGKVNRYLNIAFMEKTTPKNYKYVGTVLHEVAFRASLAFGKQGFIELTAGYGSLLFHYECGFRVGERYYSEDDVIPARPFDWEDVNDHFKTHPQYGVDAFLGWKLGIETTKIAELPDEEKNTRLENVTFNDVLAFYHSGYKKATQEMQKAIRDALAEQGGVSVQLNEEAIAHKKIEYGIGAENLGIKPA